MVNEYIQDFQRRIALSFSRLYSDTYKNERVFRESAYDWEGDWEGRALLAFVCLKRLTGAEIPSMRYEIDRLAEHINENGYFGAPFDGTHISEQLLSGNGWFLRALCEYYTDYKDERIYRLIRKIVEKLYLPCEQLYQKYPIEGRGMEGEVSGNLSQKIDGWRLSTDIGCAFIALDGLTAAYKLLQEPVLKAFIDRRIAQFLAINRQKYCVQTHATLTVCRAILRMYLVDGGGMYLTSAKNLFQEYVNCGMTLTYENFNWFSREDTWTEPCAVVDSLIVSLYLYRTTGEEGYRTLARRIYFNGLTLNQRCNGGAGTSDCVTVKNPVWRAQMFEAEFCCSMRFAEGLYHVSLFEKELFEEDDSKKAGTMDEMNRYFQGDHLLCQWEDGRITTLPKIYEYSQEELKKLAIKIIF